MYGKPLFSLKKVQGRIIRESLGDRKAAVLSRMGPAPSEWG